VKKLVRRSFLHQPPDGLGLVEFRYAAVDQWIKVRTHSPGTDHGNGVMIRELQSKFALPSLTKEGMCVEQQSSSKALNCLKNTPLLGHRKSDRFRTRAATRSSA